MAYFSQEQKKEIQPKIKALLKEYSLKGSLSVRHHSGVLLTIRSGSLPLEYGTVNEYSYNRSYTGKTLEFLTKAFAILNDGNFDNSDSQSDYFHIGWYVDIYVGASSKSYQLTNQEHEVA